MLRKTRPAKGSWFKVRHLDKQLVGADHFTQFSTQGRFPERCEHGFWEKARIEQEFWWWRRKDPLQSVSRKGLHLLSSLKHPRVDQGKQAGMRCHGVQTQALGLLVYP